LNRSIYQEEASKESRRGRLRPDKSPATSKLKNEHKDILNSDLIYDTYNKSVEEKESPQKGSMQYRAMAGSPSVSPIQSRSLMRAREMRKGLAN